MEEIELLFNLKNVSVRYQNRLFHLKTKGKIAALFRCSTPKCFASVSLKTDAIPNEIKEPLVVSNYNSSHLVSCLQKNDDYFVVRGFIKNVKDNIVKNNSKTTQQIYDEMRNTHL
ncbi:unnamed protein product [Brachionus calyciflorus]|uniref:Uncharacterized protein n=1 Tax=Brachionus calyciflorus TaxID=104777 RepID=A0A813M6L3_9BILA|nr:unnamed protein product [Brachionus calyciflorus]